MNRVPAASLTCLLLAGCSSWLKSNVPVSQVYVLRPTWSTGAATPMAATPIPGTPIPATPMPATLATATAAAATIQVEFPIAAAGLATDGIAVLRSGERLDYYSAARWAGAAPGMLQMLAIDALRATHRFTMVESDAGPFGSEYVLSLELNHFEAEYTSAGPPTVHVALVGTIGKRGSRDALASVAADSRVSAEADRLQSVVAAFERATGDALSQMAAEVPGPVPVPASAKP
jgi:cholesterol transport system auxiliary component